MPRPPSAAGVPRGRPPLDETDLQQRRLAVSREAVRLFRAGADEGGSGVAAVSGAEIAAAAGISERTLWRLFRTKESCVEPVLSALIEGAREALRAWPVDVDLGEHMRAVTAEQLMTEDTDAALAIVAMGHADPALRAVWLLLQERTEPTLAEVVAPRLGLPADSPEVRVQAAVMNAALRVLADDIAAAGGRRTALDPDHEARLTAATREVLRVSGPRLAR